MTGSSWRRTGPDVLDGRMGHGPNVADARAQHGQVKSGNIGGRQLQHGQVRAQHGQLDDDVQDWGIERMAQLAIDNHDVQLWLKIAEYRIQGGLGAGNN